MDVKFKDILFVLDPGHGGTDPGAVKYILEKDANLNQALACKDEIVRHGGNVVMTRTTDKTVSLERRVKVANNYMKKFKLVIFISFHQNAGKGNGIEIYGNPGNADAKSLANEIIKQAKAIGQNSRGFKDGLDLYVIKHTDMTAILIESCFVDHKEDVKIMDTVAEQKAFGVAIAKGILKEYGVTWKEPVQYIYKVQVGSYSKKANAEKMKAELEKKGYKPTIVKTKK